MCIECMCVNKFAFPFVCVPALWVSHWTWSSPITASLTSQLALRDPLSLFL